METIPVLSRVGSFFGNDRNTPESTLEVGDAGRVRAIDGIGVKARVAFDVHVESGAASGSVTEGGTCKGIEAGKGGEAHVIRSAQGASEIHEDLGISIRCRGGCRHCLSMIRTSSGLHSQTGQHTARSGLLRNASGVSGEATGPEPVGWGAQLPSLFSMAAFRLRVGALCCATS